MTLALYSEVASVLALLLEEMVSVSALLPEAEVEHNLKVRPSCQAVVLDPYPEVVLSDPFLKKVVEHSHAAVQTFPDVVERIHEVEHNHEAEHNHEEEHSYLEVASDLYLVAEVYPSLEVV